MIHFEKISKTDAAKVVEHRTLELNTALAALTDNVKRLTMAPLPGQREFNWGDVGTLSYILETIENLNDLLTI